MEDLVVGVNAVSTAIQGGGYGERVLCAVFALRDEAGKPVYWIYNYKRGSFYPFVPADGPQQRDSERELRLKAQVGADLPGRARARALVPALGNSYLRRDIPSAPPRSSDLKYSSRPSRGGCSS